MKYKAIGLMSGTSLDGLDICYASFEKNENQWTYEILKAETLPYPEQWETRLRNAFHQSAEQIFGLHSEYGFFLGRQVLDFIKRNAIDCVDVIASHGHTVFHQPQNKFTVQVGDGRAIKSVVQLPVVYDFRMQDVLLGGNGAPLVPIGDELLFSEYDACVNLGGFSNISFKKESVRLAFDISPVNIVLNKIAEKRGLKYDVNGDLAKAGKINPELLEKWNNLDYYNEKIPKSLGIEWIYNHFFPELESDLPENISATFTEHTAFQIAEIFNKFHIQKALFTGGGTYNRHLMESISKKTQCKIIIPEPEIIEYKEALIFAFMGVLRLGNEVNVLSSATGSSFDHSSGIIA